MSVRASVSAGDPKVASVLLALRKRLAPIVLLSALVGCAAYAILTFAAPAMPRNPAAADTTMSHPSASEAAAAELDARLQRLDSGIKARSEKVSDLEAEIARNRAEIAARLDGTSVAVFVQRRRDLASELANATADRRAAEQRANAAREPEKDQSALALPEAQHAPLLHDLVQQRSRIERQIKEVSAILPPTHPRLRQLNATLKGLTQQIASESGKLADRFALQAKAAEAEEDSIRQKQADLEARLAAVRPIQAKVDAREAELAAVRSELNGMQQERREAHAQRDAYERKAELQRAHEARKAQEAKRAWAASVPGPSANLMLAALLALAMTLFAIAWTATETLLRSSYAATTPSLADFARAGETLAEPAEPVAPPPVMPPPLEAPLRAALPECFSAESATLARIEALAPRLSRARVSNFGRRTLITGEDASVDAGNEAVALANVLAGEDAQVVLVDWSPSGKGVIAKAAGITGSGMNDLLMGKADFEAILQRLPGGAAHVIACGSPLEGEPKVTADEINLVLDALDETYDHIMIAAGYCEARDLFETILGRFDAGILVCEGVGVALGSEAPQTTFLGFEVDDIDVLAFERASAPAAARFSVHGKAAEPLQARSA